MCLNSMKSGLSCSKKQTSAGSGLPCIAALGKSLLLCIGELSEATCRMLWEANPRAYISIARPIVISGRLIPMSFREKHITHWQRKQTDQSYEALKQHAQTVEYPLSAQDFVFFQNRLLSYLGDQQALYRSLQSQQTITCHLSTTKFLLTSISCYSPHRLSGF